MSFDAKQAIALGLKALRQENGESQQALADSLATNRVTVARWETAASTPAADDLYAVAAHYSTSMDDVIARGLSALSSGGAATSKTTAPRKTTKRRG